MEPINLVYVVLNINGDIIGVANSPDISVEIHRERYGETDWNDPRHIDYYTKVFEFEYQYLVKMNRIYEFELNKFYYA